MGLLRKKPPKVAAARPTKAPKLGKAPKPPKPGKQPKPPKAAKPGKPPKQPKQPKPEKQPKAAKPGKPPKPAKPQKGLVRGVVDPNDFIALRFEMVDLRARLEASEQSKAIVETRLAALDAGNSMARPPHEMGVDGEVRHRIAEFEAQLGAVAAAAAAASATAQNAAAKATAAATAVANTPPLPALTPLVPAGPVAPDPAIVARLDALTAMVDAQHAARVDPALGARVEELMHRVEAAPDANRLAELEARINAAADSTRIAEIETLISTLAAKVAEPAPAPAAVSLDSITGQLAQLNARVAAQAEVGAQLSSLRDRIGELSTTASPLPPPTQPAVDEGLAANVQALTYRVEVLAERMETSDARSRQTTEQLSAIEHRLSSVSTELTNQVSELGRDIEGYGSNGNGSSNGNGHANPGGSNGHAPVTAEMLADLQAAQIKLAADQARYEIAFRQDLAVLAEHVRRAKS